MQVFCAVLYRPIYSQYSCAMLSCAAGLRHAMLLYYTLGSQVHSACQPFFGTLVKNMNDVHAITARAVPLAECLYCSTYQYATLL